MSNIDLIIEERAADIGNFLVGRLLPFRKKRMVGPFIFIDHMGPAEMSEEENLDVDVHPHIGLSTLTYLFEGSIMHRDSLGTKIEITPGAVNWMTAGKGVVHSERTPSYLRGKKKVLHGLQVWVALPKIEEECEPSFTHVTEDKVPSWSRNGVDFKLIAGSILDKVSSVPVKSPMFFLQVHSKIRQAIDIGKDLYGEVGMYILKGSIKVEDTTFLPKQILVAKNSSLCEFVIEPDTTVFLFGGEPFQEKRHIFWNFVSTNKSRIEKAKKDWNEDNFPQIPGENKLKLKLK